MGQTNLRQSLHTLMFVSLCKTKRRLLPNQMMSVSYCLACIYYYHNKGQLTIRTNDSHLTLSFPAQPKMIKDKSCQMTQGVKHAHP